jgi:hypothetical protein
MSGLALLVGGFALAVVVFWSIVNDKVPLRGSTSGWLAMRDNGTEDNHGNGRKRSN